MCIQVHGNKNTPGRQKNKILMILRYKSLKMLSKKKEALTTPDQYHLIRKYRCFNSCEDFNKTISYAINGKGR